MLAEKSEVDMEEKVLKNVEYIVSALREAGYNPYKQLYAYAVTGDETYITRNGDARNMVISLDREDLLEYVLPFVNT